MAERAEGHLCLVVLPRARLLGTEVLKPFVLEKEKAGSQGGPCMPQPAWPWSGSRQGGTVRKQTKLRAEVCGEEVLPTSYAPRRGPGL